jgi:DNA modification methylase
VTVRILIGDVRAKLAELPADSVDCVVTSPPYWGLRDYGVAGQIGMEATLGEHLDVMVEVFDAVRRVMKPEGTLWLNYGDCYATKPNGRSAAATKAQGRDDRTFRDKPFSTVGPICVPDPRDDDRRGSQSTLTGSPPHHTPARILSGGTLKPKDLCMVPNRLAIRLQDAGWWVRSEIIWGKPNPMPDSSGRYRPSTAHEKIFLLTKSAASLYDSEAVRMPAQSGADDWKEPDNRDTTVGEGGHGNVLRVGRAKGRGPDRQRGHSRRHQGFNDRWDQMSRAEQQANGRLLRNFEPDLSAIVPPEVWEIATAAFSEAHFATFPPALASTCILAGCPVGGTVLDPFGGAGTTGLVADRLQRDAILIELNPEYAELARRRINNDAGGLFGEVATEAAA